MFFTRSDCCIKNEPSIAKVRADKELFMVLLKGAYFNSFTMFDFKVIEVTKA